ncbi:ROK family glucokinase [Geodermatophilus ruber]|uniref:Glucokinase n=1 Tax=Geodermatophilus ruber TaxID=504800 RepID=A0A1I4A8N8_9ACTN|nr:ROK family glucokinase [Geodermatophilus ruber]SFK52550.1 glucokinase [Geodermatophilus ruber]
MHRAIGVDVGGTKIAAGLVDEQGRVAATTRRDTPSTDPEKIEEAITDVVRELAVGEDVEAVGLAAAGLVDADRSTVLFAPNLAWRREPLRQAVEKRTGLPVVVENDANAAAWGESRFGAGRGEQYVVTITVGTGLGGGIVVDGRMYRGRNGVAAEFGHITVEEGGRRCGCGSRGCWERYASGTALVQEARELASVSPATAVRLLELAGGRPADIIGRHISQAAQEGDEAALECFAIVGSWLGHGMAGLAAAFDPGMFILGGGVSEAGEVLRRPTVRALEDRLTAANYRPPPRVELAELGQLAGIVGAADLSRRR